MLGRWRVPLLLLHRMRAASAISQQVHELKRAIGARKAKPKGTPVAMTLTEEQVDIISLDARSNLPYKVMSFAGTGKTSTLREATRSWLEKDASLRILYLAYNKKAAVEADKSFPGVQCRTINSLAYGGVGLSPESTLQLRKCILGGIKYVSVPRSWAIPSQISTRAVELLEKWLKSSEPALPLTTFRGDKDNEALVVARGLWEALKQGKEPISHDVYLKLYQLLQPNLATIFDVILLDEAQDVNEVMEAIITQQRCTRICVGDSRQQIYGFRGTCNMLETMGASRTYTLSKSFRLGTTIADICNRILATHGSNSPIHIVGSNGAGQVHKKELTGKYTILARSNGAAWITALHIHRNEKKKVHIVGGLSKSESKTFHLYCEVALLLAGRGHLVTHHRVKWMTKDKLENLANREYDYGTDFDDDEDNELLRAFKFYKKLTGAGYGDVYDALIDLQRSHHRARVADVLISNVHQSKGLEYDQVSLEDDFVDLTDLPNLLEKMDESKLIEEINLLYVAVSRTRVNLHIPSGNSLRQFLYGEPRTKRRSRWTDSYSDGYHIDDDDHDDDHDHDDDDDH